MLYPMVFLLPLNRPFSRETMRFNSCWFPRSLSLICCSVRRKLGTSSSSCGVALARMLCNNSDRRARTSSNSALSSSMLVLYNCARTQEQKTRNQSITSILITLSALYPFHANPITDHKTREQHVPRRSDSEEGLMPNRPIKSSARASALCAALYC